MNVRGPGPVCSCVGSTDVEFFRIACPIVGTTIECVACGKPLDSKDLPPPAVQTELFARALRGANLALAEMTGTANARKTLIVDLQNKNENMQQEKITLQTKLDILMRDRFARTHARFDAEDQRTDIRDRLGRWLSAALDDKDVCEEMKNDIRAWLAFEHPERQS